jgi:hypothetical protein
MTHAGVFSIGTGASVPAKTQLCKIIKRKTSTLFDANALSNRNNTSPVLISNNLSICLPEKGA